MADHTAEKGALADRALWRRVARTIQRGQVPWDAIGALDTLAEGVLALDAALDAASRVTPPGADQ